MGQNLILEELHATREKLLKKFDGDTAAYLRDAQARLEASGRTIWKGKIDLAEKALCEKADYRGQ